MFFYYDSYITLYRFVILSYSKGIIAMKTILVFVMFGLMASLSLLALIKCWE